MRYKNDENGTFIINFTKNLVRLHRFIEWRQVPGRCNMSQNKSFIMKKFLFMIAAVAMMASCTGNAKQSGSASAASGDEQAAGAAFEFKVENGIGGTTGSKNCHLVDIMADMPIEFQVVENGDSLDITAKLTAVHDDDTEMDENPREGAELWISGRDDDNKDIKLVLIADEDSYKALQEFFPKAQGEKVDLTFKGKATKADLEKLNGKKTTNTLVI